MTKLPLDVKSVFQQYMRNLYVVQLNILHFRSIKFQTVRESDDYSCTALHVRT